MLKQNNEIVFVSDYVEPACTTNLPRNHDSVCISNSGAHTVIGCFPVSACLPFSSAIAFD